MALKKYVVGADGAGQYIDMTEEEEAAFRATLPAAAVDPVPSVISDRQFFQMLAVMGLIEQGEALAAVKTGDMPMPLQVLLENVPMQDRFAAEMLLSGATSFDRSHPLVPMLGFAFGWSPTQIDDFWREAAKL